VPNIDAVGRSVLTDDQQFRVPAATSFSASRSTASIRRLTSSPRKLRDDAEGAGWLQPSEILR
jgi:hypothetical protein